MGDQHAGRAGVAARAQQAQHQLAGLAVERAGGLVGEDQPARADQRAGDRDALLLAAGELVREAVGELVQADLLERGERLAARLAQPDAVELARQRDVLGGGQRRDQVEVLEDVADAAAPDRGELGAR